MRQLVSVVTDEHVIYCVSDGADGVEQVAQVVNRGLDVRDVIQLGAVLVDALGLNGTELPAAPARPVAHAIAELVANAAPPPAPPERRRRPYAMPTADEQARRRVLALTWFRGHGNEVGLAEVADGLDLPNHVTTRVLAQLVANGQLVRRQVLNELKRPKWLYRLSPMGAEGTRAHDG